MRVGVAPKHVSQRINMNPNDSDNQHAWFATTHWSIVVHAASADAPQSREALETLCAKYWTPIYSYVRRRGYPPEDAQDLTQEFFARLIAQNRVAKADRERGRFRSFLLATLKHFLSDEWDKARAKKRGGGVHPLSLQFDTGEALYLHEPADTVTPEQIYERRWALTILEGVLEDLRVEYDKAGKSELFAALSMCLVGERANQPYSVLAGRMHTTEPAIKSAVHRLRARYRDLLRREIANTVHSPEEVDDELRHLLAVVAK